MEQKVAIVGLGYVGLPLLQLCRRQQVDAVGYDIDEDRVQIIQDGENPLGEEPHPLVEYTVESNRVSTDSELLANADIYVITVPTPVRGEEPDYSNVKSAVKTITGCLTGGETVILESTVAPGTCRKILKPMLEESGYRVGEDIFLAHCPERVDPGNSDWCVANIPRVLGACTAEGLENSKQFYKTILDASIYDASKIEVAEASKITENTFRDVNIAFVNELAQIFGAMNVPVDEVIEAADTKPFGFMAHWPGCGVGGHCIPVDPYYLIKESEDNGFKPDFLSLARDVNNRMPEYTVQKVIEGLNEHGQAVKGANIGLLGLSYKSGVGDKRRSPAITIKNRLEELGGNVHVYDPHLPDDSDVNQLQDLLQMDCLVIATDHGEFTALEQEDLSDVNIIVDGRNLLNPGNVDADYIGIGR